MIGLILSNIASRVLAGPCALLAGVAAIAAICGCMRCARCSMRSCGCCKRILRCSGHDKFDDFELMMLVHQATFQCTTKKLPTVVRISAGNHFAKTDTNSNSIFQQPLQLFVEQGNSNIIVDLMDTSNRVLATLSLDIAKDVLGPKLHSPEHEYTMMQKNKHVKNPALKLTLVVGQEEDAETGLLPAYGGTSLDVLMQQQFAKARAEGKESGADLSQMSVLRQVCSGPLELFEGLGKTTNVWVAVLGPPTCRRWVLGIWADKRDADAKKRPIQEVDLLKVQSIQADPDRHHVFVINCFDETRVRKCLTFRRVDRARDVWVEALHSFVGKVRDAHQVHKERRETSRTHSADTRGRAQTAHARPRSHSPRPNR